MIWLYPRVGRMKQILSCDWLPKGARWTHLAGRLEFPILVSEEKVVYGYIVNHLLTKLIQSRWLWILASFVFVFLWTKDRVEVNNIQRSWPHPWSITHKFMRSGMNRLNQGLFSFLKLAWVRIMDWRIQYSMGRGRCIRKRNWMANRKINKGEEASREGTACFGTTKTKRGKTIT